MGSSKTLRIVISAVNFTEGGQMSVLQDCLKSLLKKNDKNLEICVLVHKKNLIKEFSNDISCFEYPEIKTSWLKRIKFEFFDSKKISNQLKPDIWISLHDITPYVNCKFQVVYCHNPSPFYKLKLKEAFYDKTFTMFSFFYKYLYRINIKKNKYVILQQNWLRKEFKNRYGVDSIVAYPKIENSVIPEMKVKNKKYTFFYPSFPRIFKNFETLFEAVKILEKKRNDFEVMVTTNGKENKYIRSKLKEINPGKSLILKGKISRAEVFNLYTQTDCMVFPSCLETWGLPLSEFKLYQKPIIASDLEYAHETIGKFNMVKFFENRNSTQLAQLMNDAIDGDIVFDKNEIQNPNSPFFENWDDLIEFLLTEANKNN